MAKLTPEQKAKRSQALKEYWEKRRAAKAINTDNVDYKSLYITASTHSKEIETKLAAAEAKITELEKICKSYAEQAHNSNKTLQTMAMEYDARTKYALDCIKHAYLSVQFAVNAESNKGDK